MAQPARYREYQLHGGWTVLAGRTEADNDYLSLKLASPRDWWFHAHAVPGSHVLLRARDDGSEPDRATLEAAAAIAAWHSKSRSGGVVPVSCTLAVNVSKPRGAEPGTVTIRMERTLMVRPALPTGSDPAFENQSDAPNEHNHTARRPRAGNFATLGMKTPSSGKKNAKRRSNEQISAETRALLLKAGRRLFGTRGYEAVTADALGEAAGLTRGALHYQFGDKRGLFVAVLEDLLSELTQRVAVGTMKDMPEGPEELERGALLVLDAYGEREVQRLLLQDAPHVLGLRDWRELQERSGLAALLDHALSHWVDAGLLEAARVDATRRLLFGALMHAGVSIAGSDDRAATLASLREPLRRMIRGFAVQPAKTPARSRTSGASRPAARRAR